MPPQFLSKCRRYPELRLACPTRVPQVKNVKLKESHVSHIEKHLWVFSVEWNAPSPGLTQRNAPPAFAHLNVVAGNVQQLARFGLKNVSTDRLPEKRRSGLSFGTRTWNARTGTLLLAPSYPNGGMEGDHLAFRWTEKGTRYSISLHAWEPIQQTEATLRRVVASLPKVR
jgi:hypothetical protein